ncbi:MAG: hypothetical protein KF716_03455 [Anaerolineae bacterium]|nr:hypothetical protein [Anaerolineae bacterium]
MTTAAFSLSTVRLNFARAVTLASGLNYTFAGIALIFAPEWFFANIGNYAPYNRHYMGDAGTFTLPVGIALLWAVSDPHRYRIVLWINAGLSVMHALNHLYDDLSAGILGGQTIGLLVMGVATLAVALIQLPQRESHR